MRAIVQRGTGALAPLGVSTLQLMEAARFASRLLEQGDWGHNHRRGHYIAVLMFGLRPLIS